MADSEDARFARLLDWVEGRLSEDEARALERQVAEADGATRAEVAWLRAFARVSEDVVIASPPPQVRGTLIDRFEAYAERKRQPGFLKRLVATLAFDSGMQPAAGLRTAGAPEAQRQLIYSTDVADVALDVRVRPQEELLDLDGQIFPTNGADPGGFFVRLVGGFSGVGTATTNELGEFTFEALSPGVYEVIASGERVEISIPHLEVRRGT
jgi:hypothetical protein